MALALGTNGVRAKFDELNPATAMDFGFGFAKFIQAGCKMKPGPDANGKLPTVALGRDMRLTSPAISHAVAAGLMEGGCDVLDLGIVTSPLAEWAAHHYGTQGLIIVTASHNPAEWNALKFVDWNGVAVSKERGDAIAAYVGKPHRLLLEWQNIGKMRSVADRVISEYQHAVLKFVDMAAIAKKKHFKIVIDVGNGTSTLVAPVLLRKLGAHVVVLNEKLDGRFPGRPSEPVESNLSSLLETVPLVGADFGIALDGDADRVIFVDEKGRFMVGDKCVALAVEWALHSAVQSSKPPYIVLTTVATSRVVEDVAKKYGAATEYTNVGAPYLAEKFHELGSSAISGGEEVGGIVWPTFSLAKDGVLAACKLMEMVAQKPLSAWHDELPKYYNAKTKVECSAAQKAKAMEAARALGKASAKADTSAASGASTRLSRLHLLPEGFRLDFPDSWAIARASGTENYVRIFAEAKTEKQARELMEEYKKKVEAMLS